MLSRPASLEDSKAPRGLEGWIFLRLVLFEFAMVVGVENVEELLKEEILRGSWYEGGNWGTPHEQGKMESTSRCVGLGQFVTIRVHKVHVFVTSRECDRTARLPAIDGDLLIAYMSSIP